MLCDLELVDLCAHAADEIVTDELVCSFILADDAGLPRQKVRHELVLMSLPFQFIAGVEDARARRQLIPIVDTLTPVVESPDLVQLVDSPELLLQVLCKSDLYIGPTRPVRRGLIVELITDDRRIVLVVIEYLAYHALGVEAIGRIGDVHVLAHAVGGTLAVEARDQNLRVLMIEPGGDGISGRAHDDFDSGLAHALDDLIHPCKIELAVARLPQPPTGLAHANDSDARILHHLDILVEPLVGHVLVIVRDAVKHCLHARSPGCGPLWTEAERQSN